MFFFYYIANWTDDYNYEILNNYILFIDCYYSEIEANTACERTVKDFTFI